MSEETAEITITYRPDERTAEARCDFLSDDPDSRDERVEALFEVVYEAVRDQLAEEDIRMTGGDLEDGRRSFGTGASEF